MKNIIKTFAFLALLSFSNLLNAQNLKSDWVELSNQFKRRSDLITNTVSGIETQVQKDKIQIDKSFFSNSNQLKDFAAKLNALLKDGTVPTRIQLNSIHKINDSLSHYMAKILIQIEQYSELKTNERIRTFQAQIEGTENRINRDIDVYNTACRNEGKDKLQYIEAEQKKAPIIKF